MFYLLLFLLIISVAIEGTLSTLPFTLICLTCLMLIKRNSYVFPLAFFAGLFLDAMNLRPLGATSLFLLIYVFLILLYQRKYEIYTYQFMMAATFIGSLVFLLVFDYDHAIVQAIVSSILGGLLFLSFNLEFNFPESKSQTTK